MENEELDRIVKESLDATTLLDDISESLTHEEMLKEIQKSNLDDGVKLRYEKAFIRKLKIWHANDLLKNGF